MRQPGLLDGGRPLVTSPYEALDHAGNTFASAFEVTTNDPGNPTDIELARFD